MATVDKKPFSLPTTFKEYLGIRKKYEKCVSYNYPADVKIITRYSGPAAVSDRSCGEVIIMMAGKTGAGKSETINKLFNKKICESSSSTSMTKLVSEIIASVTVHDHEHVVNIPLKFVDVPGARDVNASERISHQKTIKNYLTTSPSLSPRPKKIISQLESVYQNRSSIESSHTDQDRSFTSGYRRVLPNLILLVVDATDNRMLGDNSEMSETLKLFNELKIVDENKLNLLVVATHACSMPPVKFSDHTAEKTKNIRDLLVKILGEHTKETKIVFVENEPENFNLEQIPNSEFYKLPDGSLSHCTLIQEMTHRFLENGDVLGGLACGSYFSDKNAEKPNHRPITSEMAQNTDTRAESDASEINEICLDLVNELPLQFLAHGFCPLNQIEKSKTVLARGGENEIKIGTSYFTHSQISVIPIEKNEQDVLLCLSQNTPDEHTKEKLKRYELHTDAVFNLNTFKDWLSFHLFRRSLQRKLNDSVVIFLYEWRIRRAEIDCEKCNFSEDLLERLKELPKQFNAQTEDQFSNFFNEFGSHFVQKSYLGGSIKLVVSQSNLLDLSEMQLVLEERFQFLMHNVKTEFFKSSSHVINGSQIMVFMNGGIPSTVTNLKELTPDIFREWIRSIELHPAELQDFLTLKPYHILTTEPLKESLRQATLRYIHVPREVPPLTRESVAESIITLMTTASVTSAFVHMSPRIAVGSVLLTVFSPFLAWAYVIVAVGRSIRNKFFEKHSSD